MKHLIIAISLVTITVACIVYLVYSPKILP